MPRLSLAVAVVVLLAATATVAAAVGPAAVGTVPVVNTTDDGPNHLAINESDVAASETTTADFDVGTAIAADSASLRATYDESSFQRTMANAETETNRTRIRLRALAPIESASADLRERNQVAIEAFATGELSATEFLDERARITARADELHRVVSAIHDSLPSYQPPEDTTRRVNYLRGQLRAMQGPISTEVASQTVRGGERSSFYVEASDSGFTLAQITGGNYQRETFLGDAWRPDLADRFAKTGDALGAARNRSATLYPWVIDNQEAGGGMFGDGIYWTSWDIPGGEVGIYLDGGTTDVFHEIQTRAVLSFDRTEVINRTSESIRITVDRTYESGPAAVTLRNVGSGTPIEGTVAIGDRDPVPVGPDGTLWFVEPRNDVTITATADGTDFSVTV